MELIVNSQILTVRNTKGTNLGALMNKSYSECKAKIINFQNCIDTKEAALLGLFVNSTNLESLEITERSIFYIVNAHQSYIKNLKSLTLIDSLILSKEDYQSKIYELLDSLQDLCLSYKSKDDLFSKVAYNISLLSHLQTLTLIQGQNFKFQVSLKRIVNLIEILKQNNKCLREVRIEVYKIKIDGLVSNKVDQFNHNVYECIKYLGKIYGMDLECTNWDSYWTKINIKMEDKEKQWSIYTKKLSIGYWK
ncbi:hypothetical protein FGO68_gene4572 [Halteria grandinella]|uniref:Uncharacterized protein n=1 Tax=Halteria grandinella TaxID=5974 RepID=A0A8J8NSH8_HALGN|nr:hypothetical protein FGO68_gene4572 [Halteria grandinella]